MSRFTERIVSEILTRLPAKSLCRFRSVSKGWYSAISTPHNTPPASKWVKLDRAIRYPAESPTEPTQLTSTPHSYTLSINPHLLLKPDEPLTDPERGHFPPMVLASTHGLILFAVSICPDPFKHGLAGFAKLPWRTRMEKQRDGGTGYVLIHGRDPTEDVLFVANPVSKECARLPRAPHYILLRGYGFIFRTGEFVVAAYCEDKEGGKAKLVCYSSETGRWVTKKARRKGLGSSTRWMGFLGFEVGGRLVWPDVRFGVIIWEEDPFAGARNEDEAKCVFVPLPDGRGRGDCTAEMMCLRCLDRAGDAVQYTEVFQEGEIGLKVWRLRECGGSEYEWQLVYQVPRVAIEDCFGGGSMRCVPRIAFVHPFEADTVVLNIPEAERILYFDVRTRALKSSDSYTGHYFGFPMPFVIPGCPVALPARLYADREKEQGDEHFQSQNINEAINSYSKSIAHLPNAAAYGNRAMAYLKVRRFFDAAEDCTKALELDGSYYEAYAHRALARKELGKLERALEDAKFALNLKPDSQEMKKIHAEIESLLEKESSG